MRSAMRLFALAVLSLACDGDAGPRFGSVLISVSTQGGDLDIDGYALTIDGQSAGSIGVSDAALFDELPTGTHTVQLVGVAENCAVVGDNPRQVNVGGQDPAEVDFIVQCVTTGVQVEIVTTGIDLDADGYMIGVGGGAFQAVAVNGSTVIGRLSAGDHVVRLSGLAANCSLSGSDEISVTVAAGQVVSARFAVTCTAATASVEVSVATMGEDPDPKGYLVQIADGPQALVPVNGSVVIGSLDAGTYEVSLANVAGNCTIAGGPTRQVSVTTGGSTRDTARVALSIVCERRWALAYVRPVFDEDDYYYGTPTVTLATLDDADRVDLVAGEEPDWSPDGTRVVYRAAECDYYDCTSDGLSLIGADGSGKMRLTSNATDNEPAWRPDGQKIAFTRQSQGNSMIHLMNADGTSQAPVPVPANLQWATSPTWSPDGAHLAFVCRVEDQATDICRINADGTGFVRLTSNGARNLRPAWGPDGARILFTTTLEGTSRLAVMNTDGSEPALLGTESAIQPTWSPDGTRIAFVEFACDLYAGCRHLGLSAVNADGSNHVRISSNVDARTPAWRP